MSKKSRIQKVINKTWQIIYHYRYDIFALIFMLIVIVWFFSSFFYEGHVVFSDIDIPFNVKRYPEEILGIWNGRWSTSNMLNLPRLLAISIPYIISSFFGFEGAVFIKTFIIMLIFLSALSMYLLCKRLVSVYYSKEFNFFKITALISGAIFYAINPWVIFRIQHIFLLCGYSVFPLIIMFFFNIFDPKFQSQLIKHYYIFRVKPYIRNIIDIIMLSILIAFAAGGIHYFFYAAIYLPILWGLLLMKNIWIYRHYGIERVRNMIFSFLTKGGICIIFFTIFNFYWFGIYVLSILTHATPSQNNINVVDTLSLFSRNSMPKNVMFFISYWWPMFDLNSLPFYFYMGGTAIIIIVISAAMLRSYRYNIVLLFAILLIPFVVLATGVNLPVISEIFIKVTKLPVIGSIFRDPNKLVGLMAVNFSILLVFGIEALFSSIRDNLSGSVLKNLILLGIIISIVMFVLPLKMRHVDGFYKPVKMPDEYKKVNEFIVKNTEKNSRVLYVPAADNMIQSHTGVATPYWNINGDKEGIEKATGDVAVYNSAVNTIFQHEGNKPSVEYTMNYMQYLLDRGATYRIGSYAKNLGTSGILYHSEYKGQEERQSFNKEILNMQSEITKIYEDNIFSYYKNNIPTDYMSIIENKIITPYGFSHFEAINRMEGFNSEESAVLFSSMEHVDFTGIADEKTAIESYSKEDLYLSQIEKKYYVKPFDFINDGNVFLKWSKTYLKNSEWNWFMRSLGIENPTFDFDYSDGVAVTFATSKLNLPPYKMKSAKGKLIADFDSLLRMEKFFTPDNPELFSVTANPVSEYNYFPEGHGEIVRGDPKNIWQVAKSGLIDAKQNNPYIFKIKVSGRGTNKIHFKVHFFDKDMKELGINYVVAPAEEINFESIEFSGEFVSPKGAFYMRLDLLTYQRPDQKLYWWIHDLKLFDLEKYRAKNSFKMKYNSDENGYYTIYTRLFKSIRGGIVKFDIGKESVEINSQTKNTNRFEWVKLGRFFMSRGENEIEAENIEGFNSINLIACIPESKEKMIMEPVRKNIEKSKMFFILEGENDFTYSGNIQTKRYSPELSGGRGVSLENGEMSSEFDILKSSRYSVVINSFSDLPETNGVEIKIEDVNGKIKCNEQIEFEKEKKKNEENRVVIEEIEGKEFNREVKRVKGTLVNRWKSELKNIELAEGRYRLTVKFDSRVKSLSEFNDFHKFNPNEVRIRRMVDEELNFDTGSCEKIYPYMMNSKINGNIFHINYDKTCSKDWYVYSSKKIGVSEDDEYIVKFEAVSNEIVGRHAKIIFLDENSTIIKSVYINEVPEDEKIKWNSYEQMILAPYGAKSMMVQFWCRGNRYKDGALEIKNYKVLRYKYLNVVDSIGVFEEGAKELLNKNRSNNIKSCKVKEFEFNIADYYRDYFLKKINYYKKDAMKTEFFVKIGKGKPILRFGESFHPLWELKGIKIEKKVAVNGIGQGFIINEGGTGRMEIRLRAAYYFGIIIFACGILSVISYFLIIKRRRGDSNEGEDSGNKR